MSRVPRYQPTAEIMRRDVIEPASGFGEGLSATSKSLLNIGEKKYLEAQTEKAKIAGELAGSETDFRTGGLGTVAQKSFNEAGLAVNKQLFTTDIMMKLPAAAQNAEANHQGNVKGAINEFNEVSQNFSKTIIDEAPVENRPYLQNVLKYHIGRENLSLDAKLIHEKKIQQAGQFVRSDTVANNSMLTALQSIDFTQNKEVVAAQVAASQKLLQHRFNGIDLAVQGGMLSPHEGVMAKERGLKEYQIELTAQEYKASVATGKSAEFIKQLQEKPLKGFSTVETLGLIHKLDAIGKNIGLSVGIDRSYATSQYKDYLYGLEQGGQLQVKTYNDYIAANPHRAIEAEKEQQRSYYVGQSVSNLKNLSLAEQEKELVKYRPNPNEENYGAKLVTFNKIKANLDK